MKRHLLFLAALSAAAATLCGTGSAAPTGLQGIQHFVVIYEENHSFDNLYSRWEGVNGLTNADPAHSTQISQAGVPYSCLLQNDVNLTAPPLAATCADSTAAKPFSSAFVNAPFSIDSFIPPSATTCPAPGVSAANGVPAYRGAVPATSSTASTRSSTNSTRGGRIATRRAAMRPAS